MTVRVSATDWAPGGTVGRRRRRDRPAPSPSTAPTRSTSPPARSWPTRRPSYGRSYQTPFADRIRNEAGVPVIAVGAISSWDDVNSLILAGRTDLCALGRPHLYDPQLDPARGRRTGLRRPRRPLAGARTGRAAAPRAPAARTPPNPA